MAEVLSQDEVNQLLIEDDYYDCEKYYDYEKTDERTIEAKKKVPVTPQFV